MGRMCGGRRLRRCASTTFLLCLVAFVLGSMAVTVIKWRRTSTSLAYLSPAAGTSCSSCSCQCAVKPGHLPRPSDCRETDPNMKKVLQHRISLLKEEIDLRVTVARESLKRTETAIEMSKKTSARFQNEAAKCRICVETCEEVRERAEAELVEERRLTKLWEKRARKHGWTNNSIIYVQG
ncbi:uncharacterized protein LOC116215064 [Punica granatum]|uniref:Uncharacterized protein LOC116215064 n=1 Tax=Punica granatum TaxID=22663 RepID=A0A218VUU2_PUNGR|nr:uncharacterized protein LOC116215064 [Punica granatum]OWM63791.1 hypothetical protein CDL15_Pgr006053 [Punica granatum]